MFCLLSAIPGVQAPTTEISLKKEKPWVIRDQGFNNGSWEPFSLLILRLYRASVLSAMTFNIYILELKQKAFWRQKHTSHWLWGDIITHHVATGSVHSTPRRRKWHLHHSETTLASPRSLASRPRSATISMQHLRPRKCLCPICHSEMFSRISNLILLL